MSRKLAKLLFSRDQGNYFFAHFGNFLIVVYVKEKEGIRFLFPSEGFVPSLL